jgi:surface-adhesin protein E
MKTALLLILFAFSAIALRAQSLPEWYRVYTFDESYIEMNTSVVTTISKDVSRVRFRWTFDQPQLLDTAPETKYQSRLEVMEFNCTQKEYRQFHFTFLDAAGNIAAIRDAPGEWHKVTGGMIEKLFVPGCDLIRTKARADANPDGEAQLQKVALFAFDFAKELEKANDFKPLIHRFFITQYLDGYLQDQYTNHFPNLNPETAAKLSREELQRFYVSLMNTGYLTSLYLISQLRPGMEEPTEAERIFPPDVLQLLNNHPYTARYKVRDGNFDFLADNIDNVERLRSYTDLLESISTLLRRHVNRAKAAQSHEWRAIQRYWELYEPHVARCAHQCSGLPAGTKLFDVNVPVFRLQVAEVDGTLKVVSAVSRF